jgi:hypothetical protein
MDKNAIVKANSNSLITVGYAFGGFYQPVGRGIRPSPAIYIFSRMEPHHKKSLPNIILAWKISLDKSLFL